MNPKRKAKLLSRLEVIGDFIAESTAEGLAELNKHRESPPEDGCAEVRDYYGETSCEYEPPFCCDECMYADHNRRGRHPISKRGKNPQAKRWFPKDS